MRDLYAAETIKNLMQPLLGKGFFFEYFYEQENGAPVYICRFKKGKEYLDWRETESGKEMEIALFVKERETVLDIKKKYRKQRWKFFFKNLFRKATLNDRRAFIAGLLLSELEKEQNNFFGIKL